MSGILDGRVAVITGGTRGLGLAIASAYGAAGAAVVVGSRSAPAVDRAVAELREAGHRAAGRVCDVADLAQVESLAEEALRHFGRLDVWVNNAGASAPYGPTVAIDPAAFEQAVGAIVHGTYHGSLVALRHFVPQGEGKLINLLGRGDRRPAPRQNAYGASKAWVRSFTLALAREYRASGVDIFAFNPGLVETALLTRVETVAGYESDLQRFKTIIRMWANPPEVPAQTALWLASRATDGRTGLEVRGPSAARLARGLLGEGIRRLARRPARPVDLQITTVPPVGP